MKTSYALNPCDYLFFAHHTMMHRAGQTGNLPFMVMELDGDPEPSAVAEAMSRALNAHPVLRSRANIGLLSGRPRWHVVDQTARPPHLVVDLRSHDGADTAFEADCHQRFQLGWDVFSSPQVTIDHYRLPGDRARLVLRWPHAIMDAEGAQWFMSEVNRLGTAPNSPPPGNVQPDAVHLKPLAADRLLKRLTLFKRGFSGYSDVPPTNIVGFQDGPSHGGTWRFTHRAWSGDQWEELRAVSARYCSTGKARFSRYLAACVLRALWRMYDARRIQTDAWLITLPMRMRDLPARRPLPGNYLVSATLFGRREWIADKQRVCDELSTQIDAFVNSDSDRANWALIWAAGSFREWQYRWALSRVLQKYASGFSFYGEIDPPIRSFLGAPVRNFWGSGSLSAPPGWNPVFSRFGDTLNLGLSWLEGFYSPTTAARYMHEIECELFDRDPTRS